jgi:hypothetical protein
MTEPTLFDTLVLDVALENAKQIIAIANSPEERIRVPEPVFVDKLLPFLMMEGTKTRVDYWVDVVCKRNPNREVDVIDPITGDVIFTIPALCGGTIIFNSNNSNRALPDIMHESKLIGVDNRLAARQFVEKSIGEIMRSTDVDINAERWEFIYKRYGVGGVEKEVIKDAGDKANNELSDDEEIVYDD